MATAADYEFSHEEIELITSSLDIFVGKTKDNMLLFYSTLLTNNPQYHPMFPRLAKCPVTELGSNVWMRNIQGPKNISLMYELVHKLEEDPESVRPSIRKLVFAPHHAGNNLRTEDYKNAFDALAYSLKKQVGDDCTEAHLVAWTKFFGFLSAMIDEEIQKLGKTDLATIGRAAIDKGNQKK